MVGGYTQSCTKRYTVNERAFVFQLYLPFFLSVLASADECEAFALSTSLFSLVHPR